MTDQELAARARDGDQDAFEQLVRDNEKRIYTLALRMTGSREDALDLAQDAFFQAWKALPTFQGESSFATWIYRLATNVCIDYLRKQKRRRQVESELSLDDDEAVWSEPADWSQDPQRQLERSEMAPGAAGAAAADFGAAGAVRPELPGDCPEAGAGSGNGEVPDCPGPAGAAKNFAGGWELFCAAAV